MTNFKVDAVVRRIGKSYYQVVNGKEYTVKEYSNMSIQLNEVEGSYSKKEFELVLDAQDTQIQVKEGGLKDMSLHTIVVTQVIPATNTTPKQENIIIQPQAVQVSDGYEASLLLGVKNAKVIEAALKESPFSTFVVSVKAGI